MAVTCDPGAAAPAKRGSRLLKQGTMCAVCTCIFALHPTLLDAAKTATHRHVSMEPGDGGPRTVERHTYPFSTVSLAAACDLAKLCVGALVVSRREREGVRAFWASGALLLKMAPLGAIYAMGELLTLQAVSKGSGPLYVVISNMKLVVTAVIARVLFGAARSMPWLHWAQLVVLSALAAGYTLSEAGALGDQWHWDGASTALVKCTLAALLAVVYEHTYKSGRLVVVVTLQVFWGLLALLVLYLVSASGLAAQGVAMELADDRGRPAFFSGGPTHPLCASEAHASCVASLGHAAGAASCDCISQRGWDANTLLAVLADLVNAISSAVLFKRMSAVAKYICSAMSTVPVYMLHCLAGRAAWNLRTFVIVILLCAEVAAYSLQRHRAAEMEIAKVDWTQHYA